MTRRSREQMLDETHRLLMTAGREFFGTRGYADTSMDDLTASAGLTRGALYHHFGGKSGLFAAVVDAVDAEIDARLDRVAEQASNPLTALAERAVAYIELTQAPEVQQMLFLDAPSVLPQAAQTSSTSCIASIRQLIEQSIGAGLIPARATPEALAVLINGALVDSSRWVAAASDDQRVDRLGQACDSTLQIITGLGSVDVTNLSGTHC